jgi:hypothetical protein
MSPFCQFEVNSGCWDSFVPSFVQSGQANGAAIGSGVIGTETWNQPFMGFEQRGLGLMETVDAMICLSKRREKNAKPPGIIVNINLSCTRFIFGENFDCFLKSLCCYKRSAQVADGSDCVSIRRSKQAKTSRMDIPVIQNRLVMFRLPQQEGGHVVQRS